MYIYINYGITIKNMCKSQCGCYEQRSFKDETRKIDYLKMFHILKFVKHKQKCVFLTIITYIKLKTDFTKFQTI